MTYVDVLSTVQEDMGQIQNTLANLPSVASAGGFGAVLAQIASLSGGSSGGPSSTSSSGAGGEADLSGSYGWPFEEGRLLPGENNTGSANDAGSLSATDLATAGSSSSLPSTVTGGATAGAIEPDFGDDQSTASGESPEIQNLGTEAVSEAEKFLGVPYVWGGTNPAVGVDCSGLVQDVYKSLGISLPRTSEEQVTVGEAVPSLADAEPGDLVFFPGSDGTASSPGHVGIYIGDGKMIDAPYTGTNVQVDPVGDPTEIRRVTGLGAAGTTYASYESPAVPGAAASPTGSGPTDGSTPYQADFASAAATYGVPEQLLSAVAQTESGYQPDAVSSAGAEGLMQLMPSTASSLGANAFDPAQAVPAAAQLLSSYHNQYGSWPLALAAYNAGPGAVDQYSGIPPYPQTQAYVQNVMARAGMEA